MSGEITIDIATAIKAAVVAIVPAGTSVVADGVVDDAASVNDDVAYPSVSIVVSECSPMQYRSVLRSFPVSIEVSTWYPDDRNQQTLYAIGHAVSQWLAEPSLTLTLAHWDALVLEGPPIRDVDGRVQFFRWSGMVHTRKAT